MNTRAAAMAAVLHAAILAVALVSCDAKTQPAPQKPPKEPQALTVHLLPSGGGDGPPCPKAYRGIGCAHGFAGTVIELAPDGPAEKAGIQLGDSIQNYDLLGRDRYMVGHPLDLRVWREGREFSVRVVTGWICEE